VSKAGRYELLEELGRGAMGVVYKAQDPVIGRTVAVKAMRLNAEGSGMTREELVARFQTEARAAGLLAHPNIVVVYDAGEEEGLFYITMELVGGRSLQALLDARQSFPLPRVLRIMEQACSALEFAHQRNVVHRDIKPANLMLTPDDTVKITDFGTAKILQFGTTQTAHIIGTPSYMSPEQVKGKVVDGRSDIFSLGVILYELVTGEKPFPGQNITTVIYKIVNEDPIPPRELDSSVHPGLSYVITRALAKEPPARWANCRELMEALRNYRELGTDTEATIVMPSPRSAATAASGAAGRAAGASQSAAAAPARSGGSVWFAVLLLAVIAGAGYRVWPYVREVWQRGHAPLATAAPNVAGQSQSPASPALATPEASVPPQPAAAAAPDTLEHRHDAPREEVQAAGAKAPAPPAAKTPAPRKTSEGANLQSAELKSRIEQRLAEAGLGEKVHVRVAGDTVTLSGKLTPREHRHLLNKLRDAPAWVRVVDHIEYDDSEPPEAVNGARPWKNGWAGRPAGNAVAPPAGDDTADGGFAGVFVSTTPQGAKILVDGMWVRQRTPARLGLAPGEHTLTLMLGGYTVARRTIVVDPGQTVQVEVALH